MAKHTTNLIDFSRLTLPCGLVVLAHQDPSTALASINVLYRVGSRQESPSCTGLAHLCEHLMFSGSENVPDYDAALQQVAAENNATTNNDYTNYYVTLPVSAIETALFVEADRMDNLVLTDQKVEVQKAVVVEEFAQRLTNQPYGDVWHLLRAALYPTGHPYSWPTIGLSREEILGVSTQTVLDFYTRFYTPQNAILSIVSPLESSEMLALAAKYFGTVRQKHRGSLAQDFSEYSFTNRRVEVTRDVPASLIYICIPTAGRTSRQVQVLDVATDILSGGESSRLVQRLVKGRAIFSSVNCYISAEEGTGLLVATGRLMPGTTMAQAEEALWTELQNIVHNPPTHYEITKVRNKFEANNHFNNLNSLSKAMNLAYYEFLGTAGMINTTVETHQSVDIQEIVEVCEEILQPHKATTLLYHHSQKKTDDTQKPTENQPTDPAGPHPHHHPPHEQRHGATHNALRWGRGGAPNAGL